MNIIAFVGKIKSGKSTACDVLKEQGYEVLNFADPLKEMVSMLLDIPLEWCYDQEEKEKERPFSLYSEDLALLLDSEGLELPRSLQGPPFFTFKSLREVLQWFGSELLREADKDFWVKKLLNKLEPNKKYAISDCRFENEVKAIKDVGGTVVFIKRPGIVSTSTHQSEQVDNLSYDFAVLNTNLNQFKLDIKIIGELAFIKQVNL